MKKLLFIILMVLCSLAVYSDDNEVVTSGENTSEAVINHKMIERFNAVEFDESTITCLDLIKSYSIDDVRLIYTAYRQGEFVVHDKKMLDIKLAELKSETKNTNTYVKQVRLYTNK